ncbi:M61 family metallopeptidase [Lichenicoccus sp.]|uniref:M61 family metallopeptidase n=1 Tax=Lichenicoccus sp. TaxID=2781899 RepID=UPI003D143092
MIRLASLLATLSLLSLAALPAKADQPPPAPLPMPPAVPLPRDVPYPGAITLAVDATDLAHHIMSVHETIPVARAGDLILHYPQWIPGAHGPTGPIELLAGLAAHAGGALLDWRRDAVDMYAFHVPVPAGAASISVDFQFLSPAIENQGRVVMTPAMLDLQWNIVALYPAGYFARDIQVAPSLRLPSGWQFATALAATGAADPATGRVQFAPVPFSTLLDSPLYAGRYFERLDLDPGGKVPVHLDIVADRPSELAVTPAQLAAHRAIVQQAYRLYGSHHYDHYDFLLALSDELTDEGLEHHRSSENATAGNYFSEWDKTADGRDLLTHEYTHSWNGKYLRPADLWSPDFNSLPERDSLLWVYEGMTEYWGQVLAARARLWSRDQALDMLAVEAALMRAEVGRAWRPLEDTTNSAIFVRRRGLPWPDWQRGEDYYLEGVLLWLDADTLIRARSHGARSLDDVARGLFSTNDGSFVTSTYRFDDVVHALNAVLPYDWAGFLHARLDRRGGSAPLDGLTRGGYRLVMTDKKSPLFESFEQGRKIRDFSFSIGLVLKDAKIASVAWNSPAYKAGLIEGDTLAGIDGSSFQGADDLADAITQARQTGAPIQLLVTSGRRYRAVQVEDRTGLQYPHLVRAGGGQASLDTILAAKP